MTPHVLASLIVPVLLCAGIAGTAGVTIDATINVFTNTERLQGTFERTIPWKQKNWGLRRLSASTACAGATVRENGWRSF